MEYYGNLRGTGYKAFTGDRMAMGLLEYSFCYGSVWDIKPNWEGLKRIVKLTFLTGLAWSELSDRSRKLAADRDIPALTTDGLYHEYGFSIGDRFNLCRLDFITNNKSNKSVLFSFNFMR